MPDFLTCSGCGLLLAVYDGQEAVIKHMGRVVVVALPIKIKCHKCATWNQYIMAGAKVTCLRSVPALRGRQTNERTYQDGKSETSC